MPLFGTNDRYQFRNFLNMQNDESGPPASSTRKRLRLTLAWRAVNNILPSAMLSRCAMKEMQRSPLKDVSMPSETRLMRHRWLGLVKCLTLLRTVSAGSEQYLVAEHGQRKTTF